MQEFFKQREKKSNNIMFHVLHGEEKKLLCGKISSYIKGCPCKTIKKSMKKVLSDAFVL